MSRCAPQQADICAPECTCLHHQQHSSRHRLPFTAVALAILLHVRVILSLPDMVLWFAALSAALHTEPIQGATADCGHKYSCHSWARHLDNMAGACSSLRARP